MGCFPLQHLLLKACTARSPKIKVMTVDGKCLRFPAPTIVKELLMEYPFHSLFLSDSVRTLGHRARPLHSTAFLQPGFVYFLVPQPAIASSRSHSHAAAPLQPSGPEAAAAAPQNTPQRKVSFAIPVAESEESSACAFDSEATMAISKGAATMESLKKSAVEFLPSPTEGVLRLKMVVSKKQLGRVLKEGGDYVSMVEGLLSPLLREAEEAAAVKSSRLYCNVSWRPSLHSIPESTVGNPS